MLHLCLDRDAVWDVAVNLMTRSNIYFVRPVQPGGECWMLREGGLSLLSACFPALGNAASDLLSHRLLDATNLLFSALELSRQCSGVFSLAVAAHST